LAKFCNGRNDFSSEMKKCNRFNELLLLKPMHDIVKTVQRHAAFRLNRSKTVWNTVMPGCQAYILPQMHRNRVILSMFPVVCWIFCSRTKKYYVVDCIQKKIRNFQCVFLFLLIQSVLEDKILNTCNIWPIAIQSHSHNSDLLKIHRYCQWWALITTFQVYVHSCEFVYWKKKSESLWKRNWVRWSLRNLSFCTIWLCLIAKYIR